MCGIFGYIGSKNGLSLGLEGIRSLEYRGYDSAGAAFFHDKKIYVTKAVGTVGELEKKLLGKRINSPLAIYHSRWATHGGVTEANAHPHTDCSGAIALVHNGIIENFKELKNELVSHGHRFRSETDSEVIAHLIEEELRHASFEDAVRFALRRVIGTYGLAVMLEHEPSCLVIARNFSPILIGVGEKEHFVASDASALLRHTRDVITLQDGEIAVLTPTTVHISDLFRNTIVRKSEIIQWDAERISKEHYPHFMLKEIFEQPEAIKNSIRGRIMEDTGTVKLGGIHGAEEILRTAKRMWISACGTAFFAGEAGKYMIEEYAGIPVELDIASEFRYRKPIFQDGDVFFAISQSGETADTLAALREAKTKGVPVFAVVNSVGSTIAKEAGKGIYQHAGPEIGVASTKAFVSQVAVLALVAIHMGRSRAMSLTIGKRIGEELKKIPHHIDSILRHAEDIKKIAETYHTYPNFFYLGRKYNYPVAKEGALKLKEISYIHAEGYSAGEMKHGPLALVDKNFPSIVIAPKDSVYEKTLSNIQEIKARRGPVIAITTEDNSELETLADDVIYIPKTLEMLTPLLSVIPLQLFAYYAGVAKGYDVDKPRNLAKSVTVE